MNCVFTKLLKIYKTMRRKEDDLNFHIQIYFSSFETYEITLGIYEFDDFITFLFF